MTNFLTIMDLKIQPSFNTKLDFLKCQNIEFSPLNPILIIYIIAKIITFFTNVKSLQNFVYLVSEIYQTAARDNYEKYLNVGSEFA